MKSINSKKWLLSLTILWVFTILCIGSWWLFLVIKLSTHLKVANVNTGVDYMRMAKWEGGFFIVLLITISFSLIYLYLQELKLTSNLKAFYASLTHELKTPLASMRLQAEVINDLVEQKQTADLTSFSMRLIEDSKRLELEMDKILHLSRVEQGGVLTLQNIHVERFLTNLIQKHYPSVKIELINFSDDLVIQADEFCLSLIFRNLVDNSLKHVKNLGTIQIGVEEKLQKPFLYYQDGGQFTGNINKIGTLFYKHNSPKGSGIGLYLISKLMKQMSGNLNIAHSPLRFELEFKTGGQAV